MPDTLTTITHLINSPPGQLAAGGVLAGIVWKFFERVESVLKDDTKLEIAVWLLGVKVGQRLEPWPETFIKLFDRVFGKKHLSWRCFWRSSYASIVAVLLSQVVVATLLKQSKGTESLRFFLEITAVAGLVNIVPDYLSLLETRLSIGLLGRSMSPRRIGFALFSNVVVTSLLALVATFMVEVVLLSRPHHSLEPRLWLPMVRFEVQRVIPTVSGLVLRERLYMGGSQVRFISLYPAFFTSIWLWLYAGSGFLLKAARRFDVGFDWFNRKFDIEKKPLQSIGLVAGALVALVYWMAVVVSRVVG
jgi:hypothetical protein